MEIKYKILVRKPNDEVCLLSDVTYTKESALNLIERLKDNHMYLDYEYIGCLAYTANDFWFEKYTENNKKISGLIDIIKNKMCLE